MCAIPKDKQQERLTVTSPFDIFLWPSGISLWHLSLMFLFHVVISSKTILLFLSLTFQKDSFNLLSESSDGPDGIWTQKRLGGIQTLRSSNLIMDRAGFEPAASALRTRRSYRTDLPALFWKNTVMKPFRAFGKIYLEIFGTFLKIQRPWLFYFFYFWFAPT